MKNVLKLSLLTAGIALSSSVIAQEAIKSDAKTTATQLETPKTAESRTGGTTSTKQDPVKTSGSGSSTSSSSKTDSPADTTATGGGTRMAISEQGTPKKNKNKGKSKTSAPPTEAPKK